MPIGRVFLRTVVGGYFIGHGTQKLFGWFDGHGLDATAGMFGQLGLRPPKAHAVLAGAAEAGGGAALLLGGATPLASAALIATMITAIRTVHGKNGPFITTQGYEYNLVLIAIAAALAESGPGAPSIDRLLGIEKSGPKWAMLALALGALGSTAAIEGSKLFPAPAPEPSASAEPADSAPPEPAPAPTDAA